MTSDFGMGATKRFLARLWSDECGISWFGYTNRWAGGHHLLKSGPRLGALFGIDAQQAANAVDDHDVARGLEVELPEPNEERAVADRADAARGVRVLRPR